MDEIRISPAGDGFYAAAIRREEDTIEAQHAGLERLEETPHGCALCLSSGFVFFGVEEDGDEEIERVRCRRCRPEAL